jgi:hypothetical protein
MPDGAVSVVYEAAPSEHRSRHVHEDFEEVLTHVQANGGTDKDITELCGLAATLTALREQIMRAMSK